MCSCAMGWKDWRVCVFVHSEGVCSSSRPFWKSHSAFVRSVMPRTLMSTSPSVGCRTFIGDGTVNPAVSPGSPVPGSHGAPRPRFIALTLIFRL